MGKTLFKCERHNLIKIYEAGHSMSGSSSVVRWCTDCGAVVVDVDYDGRTNPGQTMKMKYPEISKYVKNEEDFKIDKYDNLRLILAKMMGDDKNCETMGDAVDNMEKYLLEVINFFQASQTMPSDEESL